MARAKHHYNDEELKDRFCPECGEAIIIRNKKVRYCSDVCRVYAWRRRNKRSDVKRPGAKVAYGRYVD